MRRVRARVATAVLLVPSAALVRVRRAARAPVTSVLDDDAITIGSFNFPESEVLAEIYAQTLEGRGIPGAIASSTSAPASC